jgi:hypothetical protein
MIGVLFSFALLVVGEGINILAEMLSAKLPGAYSLLEYKNIFLFAMVIIGCSFLLFGYVIGYQASKSIWTVTVSSVVAILIVEPFLAYAFFQQLPEKGALVGVVLGALGFIATLVWV